MKIKMELLEKKDNKIVFSGNINDSIANAVRRYLNRIYTVAISEVDITKNGSPLYDETVAHRMGLIPLKSKKAISEKTEGEMSLKIKKEGYVYSGDLEGKDFEVVYDKLPITMLDKGQEIEIVAKIAAGKGKDHAKHAPGLIFYRNACEIILDKEFKDHVIKICEPSKIKEKGDKIIVLDNGARNLCDFCEGLAKQEKKEVETKVLSELVITVESFGQLTTNEIVNKSIDALKKDIDNLSKQLK